MAKRALLIGSPYGELAGPGRDVAVMADVLGERGFTAARCCDRDATRAGIIDAWRRFARDTKAGDAAVVYYSGHGGLAEVTPAQEAERDPSLPYRPDRYQF